MTVPTDAFPLMLTRLRCAAGMSQTGLARATGIDPGYVNQIEKGKHPNVRRGIVLSLAAALRLDEQATDRFLFAAGLAPEHDWQTLALDYGRRLDAIDAALIGMAELPLAIRPAAPAKESA